jgi:hypothetical protein
MPACAGMDGMSANRVPRLGRAGLGAARRSARRARMECRWLISASPRRYFRITFSDGVKASM